MWRHCRKLLVGCASASRVRLCSSTTQPPTADATTTTAASDKQTVTPWEVKASSSKGIDYSRVMTQFKSLPLTDELVKMLPEGVPVHRYLRRRICFSHRDFDKALGALAQHRGNLAGGTGDASEVKVKDAASSPGPPVYLYTGRGPSASSMHLGHTTPFIVTQYLQQVFQLPLVIQLTDDEKFLFKDLRAEEVDEMARANMKDIIAFGFDPKLTFIFRNTEYIQHFYKTILRVQKCFTANAVRGTFGFSMSDNVGKFAFPAIQAAPCFPSSFTSSGVFDCSEQYARKLRPLIPCAIDQDPFFLLTRNLCGRLQQTPASLLHTKFMPSLKGATEKMSSSAVDGKSVITLTDSEKSIKKKIRKAFSGGRATAGDLKTQGADTEVDVAYNLLVYFLDDDDELERIKRAYSSGEMNSGTIKQIAGDIVCQWVAKWQERRAAVTDEDVEMFSTPHCILRVR